MCVCFLGLCRYVEFICVSDDDECDSGAVQCDAGYRCRNTPGSAECVGMYTPAHNSVPTYPRLDAKLCVIIRRLRLLVCNAHIVQQNCAKSTIVCAFYYTSVTFCRKVGCAL